MFGKTKEFLGHWHESFTTGKLILIPFETDNVMKPTRTMAHGSTKFVTGSFLQEPGLAFSEYSHMNACNRR
jgi:hypothetical protein